MELHPLIVIINLLYVSIHHLLIAPQSWLELHFLSREVCPAWS